MANIDGDSSDNVLNGTTADDTINGLGGDDIINGGDGNDTLYGDAGNSLESAGEDASALSLSISNLVSDSSTGDNNAVAGDTAIYEKVAQLDDGTWISGRLVLVETSDSSLNVDLSGGDGFEILLNSGNGASSSNGGETATFRMEFFDPSTGEAVSINSTATFNDLDRNNPGDQESVTQLGGRL